MRYLFLLILSLSCTATIAQQHKKPIRFKRPSPKEIIRDEIACECFSTNKYNKADRLHFYPFNKAQSVTLISFKEDEGIPLTNKNIDIQKVLEKITLTNGQIDSLTNILYNIGFTPLKGANPSLSSYSCYEPRNGILFTDAAGKVFEYIEICFACKRTRTSSDAVNEGEYCSTKLDLLKTFFSAAGINYGTGDRHPLKTYKEIFELDSDEVVSALKDKISKKTKEGKDLNTIGETERTLFFAIKSDQIYNGSAVLSGLAKFYLNTSGNFYQQTLTELKKVGAIRTLKVMRASKFQWPERRVSQSLRKRRATLLTIINKANPEWKKLESGLFDCHDIVGGEECTRKEDLTGLIFEFAKLHRGELTD